MPLTIKSESGKILAKEENPTVFRLTAEDKENIKVVWSKRLQDFLNSKKGGTGYIPKSTFDAMNVSTVPIPANFAGLEAVDVPPRLEEQLFRIYAVEENEDYVTVRARHVWYDNLQNYTLWKPTEDTSYTAAAVCRNILTNAVSPVESEVASDCTDTKPGSEFDYERKNLVECFLDPEKGVCAKFGLSLIRDNWDFYCLKNVGFDRGYVIQTGKNLLGVVREESIENVVTRTCPIGMDSKGDIVWLNNDGKKWVDSQYIGDYSYPRVEIFDTGIQIGQDGTTAENINEKLYQAAQKRFSEDKADLPQVTMTIDFLSIGDTEEYAQYRGLDKVYLYDIITIKDTVRGYEYSAQVVGVEHDVLTGMLVSITIGSIQNSDGVRKIATWQVPEVSGENIRLKSIMAGSFLPGAINADDIASGAVATIHLASATIDDLTSESITAVTANIHEIIAGSITADDIQAGSITATELDAQSVRSAIITAGSITATDIDATSVRSAIIAAGKITADDINASSVRAGIIAAGKITADDINASSVRAGIIAAGKISAADIEAGAITADAIDATSVSAINAKLGTATIANGYITNADIDFARVKDMNIGTAVIETGITEQGIANKLYINRLMITYGQMVQATIGDLVIGASNGNYYHVDVEWDEDGVPSLVPTQVATPSAAEIAAGHTSDGKTIVGDVGTFADLSSEDFYAINGIIDVITAKRIDVDELWARQAFIGKLMTTDISSNTYIQSTIGTWQSGSTITQEINSLNSRISQLGYGTVYYSETEPDHNNLLPGDIWIQPVEDNTWDDVAEYTWEEISGWSWEQVAGQYRMYCWNGDEFKIMFDNLFVSELQTEINQTAAMVQLKADKTVVEGLSGQVEQFGATLEVQAEEIESAVSAVNAKTANYTQLSDPSQDQSISLHLGDTWTKYVGNGTWNSVANYTWNQIGNLTWDELAGNSIFTWNGSAWIQTGNYGAVLQNRTMIDQTTKQIELLAEEQLTIEDQVYRNTASITVTAQEIRQEVQRATAAENGKIAKTSQYQTADAIVSSAVAQAAQGASLLYVAGTSQMMTAESIVTNAKKEASWNVAPEFSTTTQYSAGDVVSYSGNVYIFNTSHMGAWNSSHVTQTNINNVSKGAYIAQTDTIHTAEGIITTARREITGSETGMAIARTVQYQTADSIVLGARSEAVLSIAPAFSVLVDYVVGDVVSYQGFVYKFIANHSHGAWNSSHVQSTNINTVTAGGYIAKAGIYTTADAIRLEAQKGSVAAIAPAFSTSTAYSKGDLVTYNGYLYKFRANKSAGAWNVNYVESADVEDSFYDIKSGIEIESEGIKISGSKYLQLVSGGYIEFKTGNSTKMLLNANGIDMQTAGKFYLHAKDSSNSGIIFGTNKENATFYVGQDGDVKCHSISTDEFIGLPKIAVSEKEPSGNGIIWVKPTSSSQKTWAFRPNSLVLDQQTGNDYYKTFSFGYSGSDYLSGNLYYGITARLHFYNLSTYSSRYFKAYIRGVSSSGTTSWIELGTVTDFVQTGRTLKLDADLATAAANIMNPNRGNFEVWLQTNAPSSECMLLNEDIQIRAKTTSSGSYAACTVFYKQ